LAGRVAAGKLRPVGGRRDDPQACAAGHVRQTAAVSDFSFKPTLTGERVILRPLDETDFDAMRVVYDDPESIRLTGSHGEIGDDRARDWLRTRLVRRPSKPCRLSKRPGCGKVGRFLHLVVRDQIVNADAGSGVTTDGNRKFAGLPEPLGDPGAE